MTGKFFTSAGLRAVGVGLIIGVLFLTVTESLPPTWDEGDSIARAESVLTWARGVGKTDSTANPSPWSERTLQKFFPNTVSREGHPAGYVIVIAAGKAFCDSVGLTLKKENVETDSTAESVSDKAATLTPDQMTDGSPNKTARTENNATSRGLLSEKVAWRFGPIFLWATALAAVFYRLEKTFSLAAALFGIASILILPRVFVHAQIAFGDSVLMSGWLLIWAGFDSALRRLGSAAVWGIFLGLTAAAKFTGAAAAIPFGLFAVGLLFGDSSSRRSAARIFGIGFPAAILTFFLLNPPIWHSPLDGIAAYVHLNTHRSAFNIAIRFLGETYNLDRPLPWWNPLFWTGVTVPVGLLFSGVAVIFLTLFSIGHRFFRAAGTTEPEGSAKPVSPHQTDSFFGRRQGPLFLLILNWGILIVIRMFPGLPVHDGVRLFVAAFPFFGILAGIGLACLWERRGVVYRSAAVLILTGSATSLILYFPQGLSYYNLLIGGLPGAARAGMEVTYYWDGLDRTFLDDLARCVSEDAEKRERETKGDDEKKESHKIGMDEGTPKKAVAAILFSSASYGTLARVRQWNDFPPRIETITRLAGRKEAGRILKTTDFRFYVLQIRGGGLTAPDRWLLAKKAPLGVKIAGRPGLTEYPTDGAAANRGNPWKLNAAPILAVYAYPDFLAACRAVTPQRKDGM